MRSIGKGRMLALGLALLVGAGAAVAMATAEPVALLVKFQGEVTVQPEGSAASNGAQIGMQLSPGDRILVASGGEAVVLYRTGRMVRASADVTIERVEEEGASSLFTNTVRTLGQVAATDARTQPNRQGMIRPIAGAPVPVSPRNGITVLDTRPTFTWLHAEGATGYVLQLRRVGPDAPRPVRFDVGADTTFRLPRAHPPLVPGATYTWTVGGEGVGRVAELQRFTVASAADLGRVEEAATSLIEAGIDPASDGLFLMALALRDAGLFYEAEAALDRMAEEGTGVGRSYEMLRGEVLDRLGRIEAAEAAFRRADAMAGG